MLDEFYPTPESLLSKVFSGMDWNKIQTVLEPSAGKGDIVDYLQKVVPYRRELDIDCIEKEEVLRKTLIGKEYRVIHDDFMTFRSQKSYDLIVMNPPFSEGAAHLAKALKMQKQWGFSHLYLECRDYPKSIYQGTEAASDRPRKNRGTN